MQVGRRAVSTPDDGLESIELGGLDGFEVQAGPARLVGRETAMRLSAKIEYACLAIIALARQDQDESPVRVRVIAEGNGIPEKYLVQILLQLKAANLVRSTRGSLGGYRLARSAQTISLLEVIHAIEGPEPSVRDEQSLASRVLASVIDRIRSAEQRVLAQTNIAQLADLSSPHDWVI